MTITYIHHSGYLLETEQALLLFDFVEGALPPQIDEQPVALAMYILSPKSCVISLA